VLGQERHQLVAQPRLAPASLGVLLEPRILAHLRRATGPRAAIAHWRTTRTAGAWATVAKRRTRTTRATIPERRAWATRATVAERRTGAARTTIPERDTRARAAHAGHRRHTALEGRAVATTIGSAETLATARGTTAALAAALSATAATVTGAAGTTATTAARSERHVATTAIVVVHAAAIRALTTATAIAIAVRAHLHDNRRPVIIERRGRGWGDAKLLEIRKLLQQRFLKTLSHPFSYCARAVPTLGARSR
jgi:hypothetical protein